MNSATNHHCNVVEIADYGVLIEGASGVGKTSLALGLLEHAVICGANAGFVCDDQALLKADEGRLLARAPANLAGKLEIRGLGIVDTDYVEQTTIDLVVRLVDDQLVERIPEKQTVSLLGIELPLMLLPSRHEMMARRIVLGWIDSQISK